MSKTTGFVQLKPLKNTNKNESGQIGEQILNSYKRAQSNLQLLDPQITKVDDALKDKKSCISSLEAENSLRYNQKRKRDYRAKTLEMTERSKRKWLVSKGKSHVLDFSDEELVKLRKFFQSLDTDGKDGISVEEL